ncbi:MAG: carbon-nitrogen hydrolase family protein [Chloroflexi bacterium]|nr:carbon-nitrogen hydrolase family protein [Chloroflexota bacterium]
MMQTSVTPAYRQLSGRPVRITSLSFYDKTLEAIAELVDAEGAQGVDLIALPETWNMQAKNQPETLDGPTVTRMAELAQKHRSYLVCPIDRLDGERRVNSAVLIDRLGRIVCVYDKIYPYWSEFNLTPIVQPGQSEPPVYQADFGRIGMAICFDVNFPSVWQALADQGAELIIWPSAYSAGTSLQAHALNHHYAIVTSTYTKDCIVYDINGQEILYEKSEDLNISRVMLDLDRGIYHENFNMAKRDQLLAEHGDEVEMEQWQTREQWFILRAKRPGVSARQLACQYGLEELRDYLVRSRQAIDQMRAKRLTPVA